jgi:hypothetical protein
MRIKEPINNKDRPILIIINPLVDQSGLLYIKDCGGPTIDLL